MSNLNVSNDDFVDLEKTCHNFEEAFGEKIGPYFDERYEVFVMRLKKLRYEEDPKLFRFVKEKQMLMYTGRNELYNILKRNVKARPYDLFVLNTIDEFYTDKILSKGEMERLYDYGLKTGKITIH